MTDPTILLQRLQKSLHILEQREAKYGIDAPASLKLEIEDHETAIGLTEQLAAGNLSETAWREQLKPLLVTIEEREATEAVTSLKIGGVNFSDIKGSTFTVGDIDASVHIHSQPPRDRNLTTLMQNVYKIWVEDFLNSALLNAIYIDLGLQQKEDAVPQPFEELNIRLRRSEQADDRDLPTGTRAIDVYRQAGGGLLILGQPEAGKTTTLATLAGDLVAEAENDPSAPVPVIFNLSGWAAEQKPLAEWLAGELNRQYQVSKKLAQSWLAQGQLALLLDGLDEVAAEQREACVAAINTYRENEYAGPVVVCSRLNDYESLEAKLKLGQAIVLKKLTQQQVEQYFERLQTQQTNHPPNRPSNKTTNHLTTLFERIWQDEALQELAETPLMLNIITVTYATPEAPPLPEGKGGTLRTEILRAYTERMFERVGRTKIELLHPKETSLRYLRYLAAQLQNHSLTQFSIGQIRGSWLLPDRPTQHRLSRLSLGLFGGQKPAESLQWIWKSALIALGGGMLGGLLAGGGIGLLAEAGLILPAWLSLGLIFGLTVGLSVGLTRGLSGGLILGLIFGLIALAAGLGEEPAIDRLFGGLFFGLTSGLFFGLIGGLTIEQDSHKIEPDQEIRRSRRNALLSGLISGVILCLIFGLTSGLIVGLSEGLSFGLLFGLLGVLIVGYVRGGGFLVDHYIRLLQLNQNNLLPFKLIPFLDQATELIFLQRVGGSYRFIHRSVQEYFAAQYIVSLSSERQMRYFLRRHLTDDNWQEVFLMTASLLDEADIFFDILLEEIEALVVDEPNLREVLQWAAHRADAVAVPYNPAAVRGFYLTLDFEFALGLGINLAHAFDHNSRLFRALSHDLILEGVSDLPHSLAHGTAHMIVSTHALACVRDIIRALDRDLFFLTLDLDRTLTIALIRDFGRVYIFDYPPDLELDRTLNHALDKALTRIHSNQLLLDWELGNSCLRYINVIKFIRKSDRPLERHDQFTHYFARLVAASEQLGLSQLQTALASLALPTAEAPSTAWATFKADLLRVIRRERGLAHDWTLTEEQEEALNRYLVANRQAVDCLNVATVSNREGILERVFLPPGAER